MQQTAVSIDEYLHTSYTPDVDYVDGWIEERHVGEKNHGKLILRLAVLLSAMKGVFPFIETRLQVSGNRFRVPDVCAYLDAEPDEQVFTKPPFLRVEVLSPEDRVSQTLSVADEYIRMGVAHVWIIDPLEKKAFEVVGGSLAAREDVLRASERIAVPLREQFEGLRAI